MNDMNDLLEEFKKAGWLFAVLGGLGALARLILTDEKYNTIKWIRMIIAGSIVGVICYFALHQLSIDPFYKSVICAVSGTFAQELFHQIRNKIKSYNE
jgi:hypothetical protein